MTGLYKDRYRIDSTRLQKWDYSTPACYFITICTKDRFCWFGHIINKKTVLSDPGRTVNRFWLKIPDYFNHVLSGRFVVMPNHIHGILILKENAIVELVC
jgi:putative transposase